MEGKLEEGFSYKRGETHLCNIYHWVSSAPVERILGMIPILSLVKIFKQRELKIFCSFPR